MKLTLIYGSESLLLQSYISQSSGKIIRIYNNLRPSIQGNCIDLKIQEGDALIDQLDSIISPIISEITEIIFIGAAFSTDKSLFISEDIEQISSNIQTNIINYTLIVKALLPFMLKKKHGRLIYLSSFRANTQTKGVAIYSGSKAFGESFFKSIGTEYGRFNITSHIIRMGYFDGRILHAFSPEKIFSIKSKVSLNRFGSEQELCTAIRYCEANPFTNAGILELTGGIDFN